MKYAFITGATSGLGKDFARILGSWGYNLILVGRRQNRLCYMKEFFIRSYNIEVECICADLSDINDIKSVLSRLDSYDIEIAINCAGFGRVTDFVRESDSDISDMLNTNVLSLHLFTKYFAARISSGYILNISSIASFVPGPVMAQYGATKAYVTSFSLACGYELKRKKSNVKICVACPGPVKSEFDKVAGSRGNFNQISTMKCAKLILKDMYRGKKLIIPGKMTKLGGMLAKIAPVSLALPFEYRIQSGKMQ